jgi:uncharacterized protein
MPKVFIIHGWEGAPVSDKNPWFPWLREKLEAKNFEVVVPEMPNPDEPKIEAWVDKLKEIASDVASDDIFIGHSIGCQAILRFLETLDKKIKKVIFVGGWITLTDEVTSDPESMEVAKPWLETKIDWEKVKSHCDSFTAVFSNNDPFVPLSDSKIFKEKLNAKIIIENKKSHFNTEDSKEIQVVLGEV